jgi:adenosylcobinamide kinase/adenosylcobinamide-phosphate guanylyltransferase
MGRLELVTGGARSGKSAFAERRAGELAAGGGGGGTVMFVATAVVTDDEMVDRIALHRARRPVGWELVEAPLDLGTVVADAARRATVVVVDCLSIWASNRLLALGQPARDASGDRSWRDAVARLEKDLVAETDGWTGAVAESPTAVVVVTNEVGFGVVPPTPLGRAFRDLLGRLNQHVAANADAVHLVVAGIPVDLRRVSA